MIRFVIQAIERGDENYLRPPTPAERREIRDQQRALESIFAAGTRQQQEAPAQEAPTPQPKPQEAAVPVPGSWQPIPNALPGSRRNWRVSWRIIEQFDGKTRGEVLFQPDSAKKPFTVPFEHTGDRLPDPSCLAELCERWERASVRGEEYPEEYYSFGQSFERSDLGVGSLRIGFCNQGHEQFLAELAAGGNRDPDPFSL